MKNTDIILKSKIYNDYLNELEYLERDRFFCRHNYEHFVSVARICYILKLEEDVDVDKDMIYSTALLHDLGRVLEIKEGINHAIASVDLAREILKLTDFSKEEFDLITAQDKDQWITEIESHTELFNKLGDRLPQALKERQEALLNAVKNH